MNEAIRNVLLTTDDDIAKLQAIELSNGHIEEFINQLKKKATAKIVLEIESMLKNQSCDDFYDTIHNAILPVNGKKIQVGDKREHVIVEGVRIAPVVVKKRTTSYEASVLEYLQIMGAVNLEHQETKTVVLTSIARGINITEAHATNILNALRNRGILSYIRGEGWYITREYSTMSISDMINLTNVSKTTDEKDTVEKTTKVFKAHKSAGLMLKLKIDILEFLQKEKAIDFGEGASSWVPTAEIPKKLNITGKYSSLLLSNLKHYGMISNVGHFGWYITYEYCSKTMDEMADELKLKPARMESKAIGSIKTRTNIDGRANMVHILTYLQAMGAVDSETAKTILASGKEIAEQINNPVPYIASLLTQLKKKGIVDNVHGEGWYIVRQYHSLEPSKIIYNR